MKNLNRQYLFALLFIGVGIYQLTLGENLEFALYTLAGVSFAANALTFEPKLLAYKKPLVILSWILIAVTGIFFLYILQFKYF